VSARVPAAAGAGARRRPRTGDIAGPHSIVEVWEQELSEGRGTLHPCAGKQDTRAHAYSYWARKREG